VIKTGLDEKKRDQLIKELQADMEKQKDTAIYQQILTAIDINDLQVWAKQEAALQAEVFKQTKELKAKQKSSGWGFCFFSSKEESTHDQTQFMKDLEKEMSQNFEAEKALGGGDAAFKMAELPKV